MYQMFAKRLVQKLRVESEMPCMRNRRNYCITVSFGQSLISVIQHGCFAVKQDIKHRANTKRGLRIVYSDPHMSMEELLMHEQSITVYCEHINTSLNHCIASQLTGFYMMGNIGR